MEAGKDVALALTCKRCTSSNRKLGDRAREFIGSTLTLKTPSTPCLKQGYVSSKAMAGDEPRMFKIPDVDLLEQIYEGATVRLAPND